MKINKKILSWLITVPASDTNFRCQLKDANIETMQEALKNKELSKAARKFIESEIRRKRKNNFKTLKDFRMMQPALLIFDMLKKEAIKLIKELDKVPYAKKFCLGCGEITKGQYCHKNHPVEWVLSEQTGDISAVKGYLSWFYKIIEKDLK